MKNNLDNAIINVDTFNSQLPENFWEINGINFWPFFRIHLWVSILNLEDRKIIVTNTKFRFKSIVKIKDTLFSFWNFMKLQKRDVLFVGNSKQHEFLNNLSYNKFFKLFMDDLDNNNFSYYYIVYDIINNEKHGVSQHRSLYKIQLFIKVYLKIKNLILRKNKKWLVPFKETLERFYSENNLIQKSDNSIRTIEYSLNKLLNYDIPIWERILNKINPQKIIQTTYDGNVGYAINIIAKKRNITTIDIQHGGQGPFHPGYSGFNYPPRNGYELLPKIFLCWDQSSAKYIELWTKDQEFHSVLNFGNPSLIYNLLKNKSPKINTTKPLILITLQFNFIDQFVLDAIAVSKNKYEWLVRIHPTLKQDNHKVVNALTRINAYNQDLFNYVNECSLTEILLNTSIHISKYSGAIIEASIIGVPSIIIDKIGVASYEDIIKDKKGYGLLSSSSKELLTLIEKLLSSKTKGINNCDEKLINENIQKLLYKY